MTIFHSQMSFTDNDKLRWSKIKLMFIHWKLKSRLYYDAYNNALCIGLLHLSIIEFELCNVLGGNTD